MNPTIQNPFKLAFLILITFAIFARAANAETYTVTSTSCTGPGSITEAMALANANPGEDTISIAPGLQIDARNCPGDSTGFVDDYYFLQATESVIIEGNDAKLLGANTWISVAGELTMLRKCWINDPVDLVVATTPGFIRVGVPDADNSAITVTARDLEFDNLGGMALVEKNASFVLEDALVRRLVSPTRRNSCGQNIIKAKEGANVTLRGNTWEKNAVHGVIFGTVGNGVIQGQDAGNLTIEDSYFRENGTTGMMLWQGQAGSEVKIVSSRFNVTGGIAVAGAATSYIVNSIWASDEWVAPGADDRTQNLSSEDMNIIASTFLFTNVECNFDCQRRGKNLGWLYRGNGNINFVQSAVEVSYPDSKGDPDYTFVRLLEDNPRIPASGFSADGATWIRPTAIQDADALKAVTGQPGLLTAQPAFRLPDLTIGRSNSFAVWATPLAPGELIDRIENAACGQANQLLNPIDNSCITVDALGNPRVDANGKRNIGAVQLTLAPHLTVTGTGDQTVDLSWTKPQFSAPTTGITGYQLRYRETGAGSWTTVPISGPDTLAHQVTGLTNGTEYEFEVRATYSPSGEGPYSNNVTATTLAPIGAPVVTATAGNGQVDLSWTKPDDGGHVIQHYVIQWRPINKKFWTGGKAVFGFGNPPATQTTVTGLTNGIEYEFAVTAYAVDFAFGPQGLATATPVAPGTIVISKLTTPAGGTGFSFTQDVDNSGDFTLDDQGSKRFNAVEPGTYTTTEADPQGLGYELTNISCVDGDPNGVASTGDAATRTATINVDSGETVQCTFYDAEEETVVIEKRTIPPGGSGFAFSDDIGTPNSFTLEDAQTRTFTNVLPGDYQVTEGTMPGYELTAIDCTVEGVPVPGDLDTRTATFTLQQPGGNAHCTFTNTKLGTIIMRKETLPDGAAEAFGYGISGPGRDIAGSLSDGDFDQVDNAKPGTWVLEETIRSDNWHLGDISCTSALGTSPFDVDEDNLKATVELAPGDTVDCTFTNVEDETITVEKVTVPAGDTTTAFAFSGSGSIGDFALLDGEKQSFSVDAEAGPYILTEADPGGSGYEVTEIACVNSQTGEITFGDLGTRTVVLNTQPGESQHCTFTNERHGQVVIRKATAPAGDTTNSFGFYGSFGSFSLRDGEERTVLDVAPGAYTVSELDPTSLSYALTDIQCTDSQPSGTPSTSDLATHTASINVDSGETVECEFVNAEANVPIQVPTLNKWGMIILTCLLLGSVLYTRRRQTLP